MQKDYNVFGKVLICVLALCLLSAQAGAAPSACLSRFLPGVKQTGSGSYHYLFWHVYDATLYAPAGQYHADAPVALTLDYKMKLTGKKIAERSADEMKHVGASDARKLAAWLADMSKIFPDVQAGSELTGLWLKNGQTVFCASDKKIGMIADPEFGKYFFGIWLDAKTSAPGLRHQLLGQGK